MRQVLINFMSVEEWKSMKNKPLVIIMPNNQEITLQVEGTRNYNKKRGKNKIICPKCDHKPFKREQDLKQHITRLHGEK